MATIRIVAGERKGHRIKVPPGAATRPTSDRVREAVFAALGPVEDLSALDLFAGSGAMGLEALSRGATTAVFVDDDRRVTDVVRDNLRGLRYQDRARILTMDYKRAIRVLARAQESFDLLFVDPPYRMLPHVGRVISSSIPALLAPGGLVVIEGPRSVRIDVGLEVVFERRYGDTVVTMVREEAGTA